MRGVYFISLLATGIFGTAYWYTSTAYLCPAPITYRLGELDSRFPVSTAELRAVFTEAEAVWEGATKRELFRYDESSDLAINFIFDERQQLASTEEEWRIKLDQDQTTYETLLVEVKDQAARYQSEEASYNIRREKYEADLRAYNQKVEEYNKEGGAPPEVYQALQEEAKGLGEQLWELTKNERMLEALSTEINTSGEKGNAKIAAYNEEVLQYNQVFGTLQTFTQGDYERTRINIYKFTDTAELTQVIAHEFGHALGVGHVAGEASVMYYLMTDRATPVLSEADTEALVAICGLNQTQASKIRHMIRTALQKIN